MVGQTLEDYARQITNVTIIGSMLVLLFYPIARSSFSLSDLEITERYALGGLISLLGMTGIMLRSGNELLIELVSDNWVSILLLSLCIPGVYAFGNAAEFADRSPLPSYRLVMLLIFLFLSILCATAAQTLVVRFLTDSDDDKIEASEYSGFTPSDTSNALTKEARSSDEVSIQNNIMQLLRKDCDSVLRNFHNRGDLARQRKPQIMREIYSLVIDGAFQSVVRSGFLNNNNNHRSVYDHFVESQGAYKIVMQNMVEIVIESLLTNYENGYINPQDVLQLALLVEMTNYKLLSKSDFPDEIDFLENKDSKFSKFYRRSPFLNFHFSGGGVNEKASKHPSKVRTIFSCCLVISYVEYLTNDYSASLVDHIDAQTLGAITEIFSESFEEHPTFYYPDYFTNTGETIRLDREGAGEGDQLLKKCDDIKKALSKFVTAYMDNRIMSNQGMYRPGENEDERNVELQIEIQRILSDIGD